MTVKWFIDSYLWAEFNPLEEKKIMCQLNGEWIMAVSFELPLMRMNYSDFRLRNPQISLPGVSTNKNLNVHLNILKGYAAYSNNKNKRTPQDKQCIQMTKDKQIRRKKTI